MANAFSTSATNLATGTETYRLFDPRALRAARIRFLRDTIPELALANSIYIPGDSYPARGWILLTAYDYGQLRDTTRTGLYGTNYALQIDECIPASTGGLAPLTLQNLVIVQARCVSTGLTGDASAIYLVELTDRRGVLVNPWFQAPTASYYNVRAPAYSNPDQYYDGSLPPGAGGVPWTWDQMVGDLWGQMGSMLGATYPHLPFVPGGTPEGWSFPGVTAWTAMNRILRHLGCSVAVDLRSATAPYTISLDGGDDPVFTALQAASVTSNRLVDDLAYIDAGSGRTPATVKVCFHRRNQYYGTEETIRLDSYQWEMRGLYGVTVAAPAAFAASVGTHYLWDDFTIRYDENGIPLAVDVATATTIAAERAAEYYARIARGTSGYMRQLYTGTIPFVTGGLVDGVAYRQDFRDNHQRHGWLTEIARGMDDPWPEVSAMGAGR